MVWTNIYLMMNYYIDLMFSNDHWNFIRWILLSVAQLLRSALGTHVPVEQVLDACYGDIHLRTQKLWITFLKISHASVSVRKVELVKRQQFLWDIFLMVDTLHSVCGHYKLMTGIIHAIDEFIDFLFIENVLEMKLSFHKLQCLIHDHWSN